MLSESQLHTDWCTSVSWETHHKSFFPLLFLPLHFQWRWWEAKYQNPKLQIQSLQHAINPFNMSSSAGNSIYALVPRLVLVLDPLLKLSVLQTYSWYSQPKYTHYYFCNSLSFLFQRDPMLSFHEWVFCFPLNGVFISFMQ